MGSLRFKGTLKNSFDLQFWVHTSREGTRFLESSQKEETNGRPRPLSVSWPGSVWTKLRFKVLRTPTDRRWDRLVGPPRTLFLLVGLGSCFSRYYYEDVGPRPTLRCVTPPTPVPLFTLFPLPRSHVVQTGGRSRPTSLVSVGERTDGDERTH